MIKFVGGEQAFGFRLKKEFKSEGSLAVLTGKNGIGKTRFLKSLAAGNTQSYIDDRLLLRNEVRYLSHEDIKPRLEGEFNYTLFEKQAKDTANYFEADKAAFVNEFDGMKVLGAGANMHEYQRLSYQDLHALSRRISARLGKPVYDLVADDIERNFELPMQGAFGGVAIARICNMYLWEKKRNREVRGRALDGEKNLVYVDRDKEDQYFGVAPWATLNDVISQLFDDKFGLNSPVSENPDFNPQLLENATGEIVSVEALSSGERGLLFFALTLFNVQYGEKLRYWVPKLLAIDEPDVHLHPQMVYRMYLVLHEFVKKFGVHIVISTHSPTTVALAPEGCVYVLSDGEITSRSKQSSVRELLDGVERVTVISDTKRQVFVESQNDAFIYQSLYSHFSNQPGYEASGVELVFLPSGDGVQENAVLEALKNVFGMDADDKTKEFVRVLNGGGCRSKVEWAVNRLVKADNFQVCGLIDWDNENNSSGKVRVLAEGQAYTIENLVYDPLCVMLYLNHELGGINKKYSNESVCGQDVGWRQWLYNPVLRQEVIDRFLNSILGRDSEADIDMVYTSGVVVKTDSAYLLLSKDELNEKLFRAYIELRKFMDGQGIYKNLGCVLARKSMLSLADGEFIPSHFAKVFADLHAV